MLRSIKDLIGYSVLAADGKAGRVKDVLFGDRNWRMRYLDVETRRGLGMILRGFTEGSESPDDVVSRRLVETKELMAPKLGIERREIPCRLTNEEVSACEGFGAHLTAEDRYEMEFRRFFRHGIYDERPFFGSLGRAGYMPPLSAYEHSDEEIRDHLNRMGKIAGEHLHSARGVIGYHAQGQDRCLGIVGDLILDVGQWKIAYMVLDTRHGIPSRKYLVDMSKVSKLDWSSSTMEVELTKESLVGMRRYWAYDSVNTDAVDHEYDYCGKLCLRNMLEEVY